MSLNDEQQRALEILADAGRNGVSDATLPAHGFSLETLAGLVLAGLATAVTETVGPALKIERYRITDAGRKAIEE
jgi:DNA-binding PadR family transcriptional regulator